VIAQAFGSPVLLFASVVAAFSVGMLAAFAVLELQWRSRSRRARRARPVRDVDLTGARPS
jgi:hypothetical protein